MIATPSFEKKAGESDDSANICQNERVMGARCYIRQLATKPEE